METATEKTVRLLLLYPKKKWKQKELAMRAGCSKAFLSKLAKKFSASGIIAKAHIGVVLINPTKLINYWCGIRKLPEPVYVKTRMSKNEILEEIKGEKNVSLTLFSGAWYRIKFMKTNTVEMYISAGKLPIVAKKIGQKSKMPTNIVLFPADKTIFEGTEIIKSVQVVSLIQNYVDLMVYGGSGARVATKLAGKYKLLG